MVVAIRPQSPASAHSRAHTRGHPTAARPPPRASARLVYPRRRVSERRPAHSPTSSILRPSLRGVADIYAAATSIPAALALVVHARAGAATLAALVYGMSLVVLLVGSAVYHRPGWPLRTALWLRTIDHANIYLLIAGSCTPLALAIGGSEGLWLLTAMWIAAGLGILKTFAWPRAPRTVSAALYVSMGALTLPSAPALRAAVGEAFPLLALGGLLYVAGATIYALRWPNPAPLVFGYHELFHMFVFAAALAHYLAIWTLVT
jgi:hemolysin III